jgi:hypothetical protein
MTRVVQGSFGTAIGRQYQSLRETHYCGHSTSLQNSGMTLLGFESAKDVVDAGNSGGSLSVGIAILQPGGGWGSFRDLGTTMVTAQDALDLAKKTGDGTAQPTTTTMTTGANLALEEWNVPLQI